MLWSVDVGILLRRSWTIFFSHTALPRLTTTLVYLLVSERL